MEVIVWQYKTTEMAEVTQIFFQPIVCHFFSSLYNFIGVTSAE
jgi:hypothetical protein